MSDNPLIGLFSSRTIVRLLSVFLMAPERSYYQQELVELTGGTLRPVQLALERLTDADLVSKLQRGRQVYYSAVPTHPAFTDLRNLFQKTFAMADVLREALGPVLSKTSIAFVYGSTARDEQRSGSDIDLMIVGTTGRRPVASALAGAEGRLGREINLSIYTPDRLKQQIASDDHFITQVLASPKIWLVGDDDELERLGG